MEPTQEQLDAFYTDLFDDPMFKRLFQDNLNRLIREYFVTGRMWELEGFDSAQLAEIFEKIDLHDGTTDGRRVNNQDDDPGS